jgi:hypothetical protein
VKTLINKDTISGVSETFEIASQATFVALGLEPGDTITFFLVLLSEALRPACPCPPYAVTFPSIVDEVPLLCNGEPITLSRDNPFVVLDAPQGFKLRAKLNATVPYTTQILLMNELTTTAINDRLRGCASEVTP